MHMLTSPEYTLGGQQGEAVAQVKAHLTTKLGEGAGSSPVPSAASCSDDIVHQV